MNSTILGSTLICLTLFGRFDFGTRLLSLPWNFIFFFHKKYVLLLTPNASLTAFQPYLLQNSTTFKRYFAISDASKLQLSSSLFMNVL